jgi:hypothetical protein
MIGLNLWIDISCCKQSFYIACHASSQEQRYIHLEENDIPSDSWFHNHIYPSDDGLSIFFRDITEKKKG